MLKRDFDDDVSVKRICNTCIGEPYLSAETERQADEDTCAYCGEAAPTLSIEDLAERMATAFDEHYIRTADQPDSWEERMMADRESGYQWVRAGYPVFNVIADAAGIPEEAVEDVLAVLQERHAHFDKDAMEEESEFGSESQYDLKRPDDHGWQEEWDFFERSLKTQARFFSQVAANHLAQVFGDIDKLKTHDNHAVVIDAGPGMALDHLFRARVLQAEGELEDALRRPDVEMGPPPPRKARAGRMNAQGISVFYGATDPHVAIAEVRPPVGSSVAVAKFTISRSLRLLDLTALANIHEEGSVFDPSLKGRLERAAFIQSLGDRMARPVMPDDEAADYLPTQAVADFLATMNDPRLDGIIFSSAQTATGCNVVLFHHAAKVADIAYPEGTEIDANTGSWTDEGWEVNYPVLERVPPLEAAPEKSEPESPIWGILTTSLDDQLPPTDDEFREPALEVDATSLEVHHVTSVVVNTARMIVHRYRIEKQEPKY